MYRGVIFYTFRYYNASAFRRLYNTREKYTTRPTDRRNEFVAGDRLLLGPKYVNIARATAGGIVYGRRYHRERARAAISTLDKSGAQELFAIRCADHTGDETKRTRALSSYRTYLRRPYNIRVS